MILFLTATSLAATLEVNSLSDDKVPDDGLVTLREALIAAEAPGNTTDLGHTSTASNTIDLSALHGTITLTEPPEYPARHFSLPQPAVLQGPPEGDLVIDGNASGAAMFWAQAEVAVAFRDLAFVNHFYDGGRGSVLNMQPGGPASRLDIERCTFRDNEGTHGAAVHVEEVPLFVTDSLFERNSGAVSVFSFDGVPIEIRRSVFRANAGAQPTSTGGALFLEVPPTSTALIDSCTFFGNSAEFGGAVSVQAAGESTPESTLRILNSTFSGNSATESGSALLVFAADIEGGGALDDTVARVDLEHVTMSGNGVGAVLVHGQGATTEAGITCKGSLFDQVPSFVEGAGGGTTWGQSLGHNLFPDLEGQRDGGDGCLGEGIDSDLFGVDPDLRLLDDNGGGLAGTAADALPIRTHALRSTSPAIDAADPNSGPTFDQRGIQRSGLPDIGAFEWTEADGDADTDADADSDVDSDTDTDSDVDSGLIDGGEGGCGCQSRTGTSGWPALLALLLIRSRRARAPGSGALRQQAREAR